MKTSDSSRPTIRRTISCVRQLGGGPDRDQAPIAQDRDPVAEAQDLLDAVRDVNDGHAVVAQPAHQGEQAVDLLVGERRGWLVQGQDAHPRL